MPESNPQSSYLARRRRQFQCIRGPGLGPLHAAILAQRAVHPGERDLVDSHRLVGSSIPPRHDVRDAESKAVAVGKTESRIVGKSGTHHRVLGDTGMQPYVMLADPLHRRSADALEAAPLLAECPVVVQRREAAVQADLMPGATHLSKDATRL